MTRTQGGDDTDGRALGGSFGESIGESFGESFGGGLEHWLGRLGKLRNVVRQELIARQLRQHLAPSPCTVLDVGAGQGTQAVLLAGLGHEVLALEPDAKMRDALVEALGTVPTEIAARVSVAGGRLGELHTALAGTTFDVVCCHGVLMYLDDGGPAIAELAAAVAPGGLLSLVARNAEGIALRPGLRGDWAGVLASLEAARTHRRYRNEIGVDARADRIDDVAAAVESHWLRVEAWYGVRVATDGVAVDTPVPDDAAELEALLDAEEALGATDPYRRVATLFHLVARA